jgi:hypothetical protein
VVNRFDILSAGEAVGWVSDEKWVLAVRIYSETWTDLLNAVHGSRSLRDELTGRRIAVAR